MENGMETGIIQGYIGFRVPKTRGTIGVIEGLCRGYIGTMEKKMQDTH